MKDFDRNTIRKVNHPGVRFDQCLLSECETLVHYHYDRLLFPLQGSSFLAILIDIFEMDVGKYVLSGAVHLLLKIIFTEYKILVWQLPPLSKPILLSIDICLPL